MGATTENLPLRERRIDLFFAVVFLSFAMASATSDLVYMLGIEASPTSANLIARGNYWYAHDTDPQFLLRPFWLRLAIGLSTFVYGPFYLVLAWALVKGRNAIQLPAVIYATMISTVTGVFVCGNAFFGEAQYRCTNPAKFLGLNLPYVVIPLLLLARMRKPMPFTRKF